MLLYKPVDIFPLVHKWINKYLKTCSFGVLSIFSKVFLSQQLNIIERHFRSTRYEVEHFFYISFHWRKIVKMVVPKIVYVFICTSKIGLILKSTSQFCKYILNTVIDLLYRKFLEVSVELSPWMIKTKLIKMIYF